MPTGSIEVFPRSSFEPASKDLDFLRIELCHRAAQVDVEVLHIRLQQPFPRAHVFCLLCSDDWYDAVRPLIYCILELVVAVVLLRRVESARGLLVALAK